MRRHILTTPALLLLLFIVVGIITRFIHLSWGQPYFFHPDERNIASAVSKLSFPDNLNPHFFAYGALPIYTTYSSGVLLNLFSLGKDTSQIFHVTFEQAILILRFFSALFSTLIIALLFTLGKKLKDMTTGLLASFLGATSIGLIQYAHFGTFELWLTLLTLLLFYTHLLFWKTPKKKYILLIAVIFGLLVSTKISSLMLFPLLLLHPVIREKVSLLRKTRTILSFGFVIGLTTLFLFLLTNPFSFLDFTSFYQSIAYESIVASGTMQVFYTGEFVKTLPVIYPLFAIYPFLLNPLLAILLIPSLCIVCYHIVKQKRGEYLLLLVYFVILFLSQTFLFVKWTRYFIPTLPFIYLLLALFMTSFIEYSSFLTRRLVRTLTLAVVGITCLIFAFAFAKTVYLSPDTRVAAAHWAKQHLPANAKIVSEVYDLGIVPFNEQFRFITLFNFYDLDNNSPEFTPQTLEKMLAESDYLVLPSQRIVKSRLLHPHTFPHGAAFYDRLFADKTQFHKIYTTSCDIWCTITYLGDPVYHFEGTSSVFDRPTVFIFQKNSYVKK